MQAFKNILPRHAGGLQRMCFVRWKTKPRTKRYRDPRKEVPTPNPGAVKGDSRVLGTGEVPAQQLLSSLESKWPRDGPGGKELWEAGMDEHLWGIARGMWQKGGHIWGKWTLGMLENKAKDKKGASNTSMTTGNFSKREELCLQYV